jgi:hypothetical protein
MAEDKKAPRDPEGGRHSVSKEEAEKNRPKPDDPRKKGDPPSQGSRRK